MLLKAKWRMAACGVSVAIGTAYRVAALDAGESRGQKPVERIAPTIGCAALCQNSWPAAKPARISAQTLPN